MKNPSQAVAAVAQIGNCVRLIGEISDIVQQALGQSQAALRDVDPTDPEAAELRLFVEQAEHFAGELQCAALYSPDCGPALAALRRLMDGRQAKPAAVPA